MVGKVRLVIAAIVAVAVAAGSVPIAAQQPGGLLQGTRALSSSIQGTAVNWTNSAMANTPIRLRDARRGRVVDSVMTDRFGAFEFDSLEPGSYVVEMMNPANDTVLAATPIINVDSGQRVAALVKLPFRPPPSGACSGLPWRRCWRSHPRPSPPVCWRRPSRAHPPPTGRFRVSDKRLALSPTESATTRAASRRPRPAAPRRRRHSRRTPTSTCSTASRCSTAIAASRSPSSC